MIGCMRTDHNCTNALLMGCLILTWEAGIHPRQRFPSVSSDSSHDLTLVMNVKGVVENPAARKERRMSSKSSSEDGNHQHPQKAFGWAARDSSGFLSPFFFSRRANGEYDVTLKILYCGICHTDRHCIRNEFGDSILPIFYPVVPGHEITGVVTEVGLKVSKFKVGDKAGIGFIVGSCRTCDGCKEDLENYCPNVVLTYNGIDSDGTITYGGFSDKVVVDEHFAVFIPQNMPLDKVAPLLCAGITVYSPMKYFGLSEPGLHLGVVGLGGLGHMAVKFGKAFGMKVTVISTSPSKRKDAIEQLGADSFLISHDAEQMKAAMGTMDGIIDTVSVAHSISPLIGLLKFDGKLVLVGSIVPLELPVIPLMWGRKIVTGTVAGSVKETQEMILFAGEHNISADVEVIPMDNVNTAMERMARSDVRYRFVIDVGNTLKAPILESTG